MNDLCPCRNFSNYYWYVNIPICTFLFWSKQRSSMFSSLLSPNLSTNIGHMCKILNVDGRLFTTHYLTYFNHYQIWWLHKGNHYINKFDSVIYVRHKYNLESCIVRNNIDLLFIEKSGFVTSLSHPNALSM